MTSLLQRVRVGPLRSIKSIESPIKLVKDLHYVKMILIALIPVYSTMPKRL